jgi:hypothetical protein
MAHIDKICAFTICSNNYLKYAKVVGDSFKQYHQDIDFFIIVVDDKLSREAENKLGHKVIYFSDLSFDGKLDMAAIYSIMELNTAVKPFVIKELFKSKYKFVIYTDPDIKSYSRYSEVISAGKIFDVVLTPHLRTPYEDDKKPSMLDIMRSGVFNLGFGGFRDTKDTNVFLDFWCNELRTNCRVDLQNGYFVDQKFCDFIPTFVENHCVIYNENYNTAYWNLHEREVSLSSNQYFVNDKEMRFFHFSGLELDNIKNLSKHQNRHRLKSDSALYKLCKQYKSDVEKADTYLSLSADESQYKYSSFSNGYLFTDAHRSAIRLFGFSVESDNNLNIIFNYDYFYTKKLIEINDFGLHLSIEIEPILIGIWFLREDIRKTFDICADAGQESLRKWFLESGQFEYKLDENVPIKTNSLEEYSPYKESGAPKKISFNKIKFTLIEEFRGSIFSRILPGSVKKYLLFGRREITIDKQKKKTNLQIIVNNFKLRQQKDFSCEIAKVQYIGYFEAPTGLGNAANSFSKLLEKNNSLVSRINVSTHYNYDHDLKNIEEDHNNDTANINFFHINADQLPMVYAVNKPRIDESIRNIGYFAWELPRFPNQWVESFDLLDDIFVPSKFIADSIQRSTKIKPKILPHFIPEDGIPDFHSLDLIKREINYLVDDFIVCIVFDLESYHERKNCIGALEACINAYAGDKKYKRVKVVIKLHGTRGKNYLLSRIDQYKRKMRIEIIDKTLSNNEMFALRKLTDVYLSLHRSEGFGMNLAENMLSGNIVIATNYSGNLDFMNSENSFLVDCNLVSVDKGAYPYHEGQWWADPITESAVNALRESYDSDCCQIQKKAKEHISTTLSEKNIYRNFCTNIITI